MNIAFFHNQLSKTDGVSLEVDKWQQVLERMGHSVHYCAGNDDSPFVYCIPELSFYHSETRKTIDNATIAFRDYPDTEAMLAHIRELASRIKRQIIAFINEKRIDCLIPNNLQSVGYNIPAMIALWEVVGETGLPSICHSHDFYFEESGEVSATSKEVREFWEKYAPPIFPNVKHVVINRLAQTALRERKGIDSTIVPNVFDFDQPLWAPDSYNSDFRQTIGIGENDLVFLQVTRVLNRKGIELAIDVVAELGKRENRKLLEQKPLYDGRVFGAESKIILLCSGYVESFGISGDYWGSLRKKAIERNVDMRYAGDRVKHRRDAANGEKVYSLWDSYVSADFVTYPSYWEGWGNQFIEAVFAKKPVVLFEYPVWKSDLAQAGFKVVSLGDTIEGGLTEGLARVSSERVQAAASETLNILQDKTLYHEVAEHNFTIAKKHYSFDALEKLIQGLIA